MGKSTFLTRLQETELFISYKTRSIHITTETSLESIQSLEKEVNLIIIDSDTPLDFLHIRSFIESNSPDSRVIFTSETLVTDETVENFTIGTISFREYSEGMNQIIDVSTIMS